MRSPERNPRLRGGAELITTQRTMFQSDKKLINRQTSRCHQWRWRRIPVEVEEIPEEEEL